jgi:hypothetical protein
MISTLKAIINKQDEAKIGGEMSSTFDVGMRQLALHWIHRAE